MTTPKPASAPPAFGKHVRVRVRCFSCGWVNRRSMDFAGRAAGRPRCVCPKCSGEIAYATPGQPLRNPNPNPPKPLIDLMAHYMPVPESGCWIWMGAWNGDGYGVVSKTLTRDFQMAHRVFYTEHKGPIAEGLLVCHRCDTPQCVNPDHLFLGTHMDNMHDMIRKGRQRTCYSVNPKGSN